MLLPKNWVVHVLRIRAAVTEIVRPRCGTISANAALDSTDTLVSILITSKKRKSSNEIWGLACFTADFDSATYSHIRISIPKSTLVEVINQKAIVALFAHYYTSLSMTPQESR